MPRPTMSECYLPITNLNDFIFCPVSIYFHNLEQDVERLTSQEVSQINGTAAHAASDEGSYSDSRHILQGIAVISEVYRLYGKIDLFDTEKGLLTERKKHIIRVYDGYVFQLYAQCVCLREMGYTVRQLRLYSMDDNKIYPVPLPEQATDRTAAFYDLLKKIESFSFDSFFQQNAEKCKHCIYEPLCSYSIA